MSIPQEPPLLSVIIPVYNEVATVALLLDQVLAAPVPKQLILVDDGSTDGSTELLEKWADHPNAILLQGPRQGGRIDHAIEGPRGSGHFREMKNRQKKSEGRLTAVLAPDTFTFWNREQGAVAFELNCQGVRPCSPLRPKHVARLQRRSAAALQRRSAAAPQRRSANSTIFSQSVFPNARPKVKALVSELRTIRIYNSQIESPLTERSMSKHLLD